MGYVVRCTPELGTSGFLQRGSIAPKWSIGTYYYHPGAAKTAAKNWVKRHPKGKAEVINFTTREVIEVFTGE